MEIRTGNSRTSSTRIVSVESCDTTPELTTQTSRSLRSGTSGYGRHVTTHPACKSNKLILGDKRSSSILHSKRMRDGPANRRSWINRGNSQNQPLCPRTPEAMCRRQSRTRRKVFGALLILRLQSQSLHNRQRRPIPGSELRGVVLVTNGSQRHGLQDLPRSDDSSSWSTYERFHKVL